MSLSAAPLAAEWDFATAERIVGVGQWDLLFDALEQAGCKLGVDGRMRALGLLGRLAAAGADLNNADLLRTHLVPILATGPEKAAEIPEVIARWRASAQSAPGGPRGGWRQQWTQRKPPDEVAVVLRADRRSRRWLVIGAVAMLLLLFAGAMGWFPPLWPHLGPNAAQPEIPPLPVNVSVDWQSRLQDLLIRVVFALPVVFFGLLLVGWRSAAGDRLVRRAGSAEWSELFTLAAERVRWFAAADSRRLFESLKQKLFTTTDRINVPASVRATLRAGMSPVVEYQVAEERSNYVVLVDRRGGGDHTDLLVQSLIAALSVAKVRFTRYEFRGRPAFCVAVTADPDVAGPALPLTMVAKRHAGERLLLVSDGEDLFERPGWRRLRNGGRYFVRPGTLVPEMNRIRDFGPAVLLTPTPRVAWGSAERTLSDAGFLVVAADANGIARIGQMIARGAEEFAGDAPGSPGEDRFVGNLAAQALRYASNIPPSPEEIASLVTDLRGWLGHTVPVEATPPGRAFVVLCAVAAFPTIAPGLTLQVAGLLSRTWGGGDAPIDSRLLAPLARLPWLRDGRMPDWLRIALLNSLDETDLRTIRELQLAVLAEARPSSGPLDAAGLDRIAAAFEVAVGKPIRELDEAAARIAPSEPGNEVERIFLAVLRGERLDPVRDVIAPEAPEAIRERLAAPERRRRAVWIAATVATTGAVSLAEPLLAGWIAARWTTIATFAATHPISLQIFGFDLSPWLGVASTIIAAECLLGWLIAALRSWADEHAHKRLLGILRFWAVLGIAAAAAYLFADPAAARMPLLFAVSTAIFLRFAPASRTPGARSIADMLPGRLEGDDWIATSLGSVVVAALALGPVFLFALPAFADPSFGLTLQLAGVVVGATSWGFGSRCVRRQLLGPVEGRPTAHEQWLDFVAPVLSLLFIAATTPALLSLAMQLSSLVGKISPSDTTTIGRPALLYFVLINILGSFCAFLTLRLRTSDNWLFKFLAAFFVVLSTAPYYLELMIYIRNRFMLPSDWLLYAEMLLFVLSLTITAVHRNFGMARLFGRAIAISIYGMLFMLVNLYLINIYNLPQDLAPLFSVFFIPAAAVLWPSLRFILMARSSAAPFTGFGEKPLAVRMRETFAAAIASAWWFVAALWLVSLRYQFLGIYIDVTALAVPLAVVAGWRCGAAATIPVLVGSLPFVVQADLLQDPAIASPGGLWPVVVLPLLARLVGDEALRRRILGRGWVSPVDCAVFVLCLTTAVPKATLNPALAVSVDPSWLAAAVGFLIGASRMRWHEPAMGFAASIVLVGAAGLRGWEFGPCFLSAASFFGGRAWRSFVVPETADFPGIRARTAIVLMLLSAIVVIMSDMFPRLVIIPFGLAVEAVPHEAPLLLLALVGGIVVRKTRPLAIFSWTMMVFMWASADVLGLGTATQITDLFFVLSAASTLVCVIGFAVLGYQLERRGEVDYARALGLVAPAPRSADRGSDAGRGHTDGGDFTERAVA